ncbi:flagellar hook-length control protein FliK [bacterium]|nr:flagellar hook-length control protein FliK [bacterium]
MKTSDVPSNRPVQSNTTNQSPRTDKKPQKEFDKVLDDNKGKLGGSLKKGEKPFSPLTSKPAYGKKSVTNDKETPRGEGKVEKEGTRQTVQREYSRVEGRGEKDHGEKDSLGKDSFKKDGPAMDAAQIQANQQVQPPQNQLSVDAAAAAKETQRPGLNINEIQSIVRRCELAVNDKGKPEFRFELETKHLGNIDLKVSTENEKVRIEFATQDVQTQEVLKENLKELGEMLQQKGMVLQETKFTPRGQDDAEKQQQQREQQEQADDYSPIDGPRRKFSL